MTEPQSTVPPTSPASSAPGLWTARGLPDLALLALTTAGLVLCYLIAWPFVSALAWAVALAVVGWPLHQRIARWVRWPTVAAGCSVGVIALLLVLPFVLIVPGVLSEALSGYQAVRARIDSGAWNGALEQHVWIGPIWEWLRQRVNLGDVLQRAGAAFTSFGSFAVKTSLIGATELVLMLFFLFYFLRDRDAITASLRDLLPLSPAEVQRMLRAAQHTIFATVCGKVLVGVVQGALGGLMFWWLGLPAAWFWAVVMGLLSIIPILGAPLVWVPAAIVLGLGGHWVQALTLSVWGAAVVGLADNLLYPIVVGRYLHLHTVPLLVAMIGGVFVFGAAGFFLGPVVLAITLAALGIWRERLRCASPEGSLCTSPEGLPCVNPNGAARVGDPPQSAG